MEFTFTGCSFTVGVGLEQEKLDVHNYCNLVSDHYRAEVKNLAAKDNSNYNIFMSALNELLHNSPDTLFVQWSGLNRLWLYPGPDTHLIVSQEAQRDYNYRDIHYTKSQLQKFADQYQLLNHDYKNLLTVIEYSNILSELATEQTNVVFINGLIPWKQDLTDLSSLDNPAEKFSKYTKQLMDFETRDDSELHKLFTSLYNAIETLDEDRWVNMFESMYSKIQDVGTDDRHPGIKSHGNYAEMIINYLEGQDEQRL